MIECVLLVVALVVALMGLWWLALIIIGFIAVVIIAREFARDRRREAEMAEFWNVTTEDDWKGWDVDEPEPHD